MSSFFVCLFHTRYNSNVLRAFYIWKQSVTTIMAVALTFTFKTIMELFVFVSSTTITGRNKQWQNLLVHHYLCHIHCIYECYLEGERVSGWKAIIWATSWVNYLVESSFQNWLKKAVKNDLLNFHANASKVILCAC